MRIKIVPGSGEVYKYVLRNIPSKTLQNDFSRAVNAHRLFTDDRSSTKMCVLCSESHIYIWDCSLAKQIMNVR